MTWRPGNSRRSYGGAVPRKLIRACPRCGARPGFRCTLTRTSGEKVPLVDTHAERKPKRGPYKKRGADGG